MAIGATVAFAASLSVASKDLSVVRTCVLTGTSASSTSESDASVHQDAAGSNFGSNSTMEVQSSILSRNRRLYVKFDLTKCAPAIPSSATVKVASLRLWISTLPLTCRTYDVFPATSSWAEGTITWNNQPFGTAENNPSGASATATAAVGTLACTVTSAGYLTWTMTSSVQSMVSGSSSNFGWMIRDNAESAVTAPFGVFSTKELANVAQSPQLIVTY